MRDVREQLFIVLNLMKHKRESSQWLGWDFSSFFHLVMVSDLIFLLTCTGIAGILLSPDSRDPWLFPLFCAGDPARFRCQKSWSRKAKWEIQVGYKKCSVILNPLSFFTGACIIKMDGKGFAESLWERQCSGVRCDRERFRLSLHPLQDSVIQLSCKH